MKCLVTGGAGFIGSHIVEALVARGDSVRVLDNLSSGSENNLKSVRQRIDLHKGDITKPDDVHKAVDGQDVIFHLAALRSVMRSIDNPFSTNEANVVGTLRILEAARKSHVGRIVYTSSSSAYGNQLKFPQTEEMTPSPISPYAVSKLAAEHYCISYCRTFDLKMVSLRYFNVFGPRQYPESQYAAVIPKFIESARSGKPLEVHSDGEQSRDFTYVANVAQANLLAAENPKAVGEVFNIANGKNYSLLDIIAVIEQLAGRKVERHHTPARLGDVRKTWADISKAKKILGYKPDIGLEEGLRRTWQWFTETGPGR